MMRRPKVGTKFLRVEVSSVIYKAKDVGGQDGVLSHRNAAVAAQEKGIAIAT